MPIKFAVNIARLKVYTAIASPMTLIFTQGHTCVSNLTTFELEISRTILKLLHWHDSRLMHGIHSHAHVDDLDLDFENV